MTIQPFNITLQRLYNQQLANTRLKTPGEVVGWLGGVQSQDYAGAKWAVGQRLRGITDADVEQAVANGSILRTHVLRPTWHFVTAADIRWMLALTAPRVNTLMSYYYRQLGLNDAIFARCNELFAKALEGGQHLTRAELIVELERAGIPSDVARMGHIVGRAELDGVICSGARRGKQQTYTLLDERVPPVKALERDEALAQLTLRYFISHGPATLKDYGWWSGLTIIDARAGFEMVKSQLISESVDDQTYWFSQSIPPAGENPPTVYLLPNYDEYIVGYTDRSALLDKQHNDKLDSRGNVVFNYTIVLDGQIIGTWKRTFKKNAVVIESTLFRALTAAETETFTAAAQRYGDFVGLPTVLL